MFSFVVFGNDCDLKSLTYDPRYVCICQEVNLKPNFINVWNQMPEIYGSEEIAMFYNRLLPLTSVDDVTKRMHVMDIHNASDATQTICPNCGGRLVLRTARKGVNVGKQFYGCSNYPRCKYTRNI